VLKISAQSEQLMALVVKGLIKLSARVAIVFDVAVPTSIPIPLIFSPFPFPPLFPLPFTFSLSSHFPPSSPLSPFSPLPYSPFLLPFPLTLPFPLSLSSCPLPPSTFLVSPCSSRFPFPFVVPFSPFRFPVYP
jgi:hypothetical protein